MRDQDNVLLLMCDRLWFSSRHDPGHNAEGDWCVNQFNMCMVAHWFSSSNGSSNAGQRTGTKATLLHWEHWRRWKLEAPPRKTGSSCNNILFQSDVQGAVAHGWAISRPQCSLQEGQQCSPVCQTSNRGATDWIFSIHSVGVNDGIQHRHIMKQHSYLILFLLLLKIIDNSGIWRERDLSWCRISVCAFHKTAGKHGFVLRMLFWELQWMRRWNMPFSVSGGSVGVRWEYEMRKIEMRSVKRKRERNLLQSFPSSDRGLQQ